MAGERVPMNAHAGRNVIHVCDVPCLAQIIGMLRFDRPFDGHCEFQFVCHTGTKLSGSQGCNQRLADKAAPGWAKQDLNQAGRIGTGIGNVLLPVYRALV